MCQCQLSSEELASGAATPPCAATVCERVGKTLVSTATLTPARASSSAARIPEPPAPTTIASNLRTGNRKLISRVSSPQNLDRPAGIGGDRQQHHDFERETQAGGLDVVHQDVAHADPGGPGEAPPGPQR